MTTILLRIFTAVAAIFMLLAPALWNGFPLLQYDTGGYLARWYEGHLEESRSTVYGLYLALLARPNFWPAVTIQAALTAWVLWLTLRAHRLGRPLVYLVTVAALSIFTTLPWIVSTLLTDIFAGLAVLALYLLIIREATLRAWERWALIVLIGFAVATHNATLAVIFGLMVAALVLRYFDPEDVSWTDLARGTGALVIGVALLLAANLAVAGRVAWTPGGTAIMFGRMLQAGIVHRYLADHCPNDRTPKLCEHRDKLPENTDLFFWGDDTFDALGRFEGLAAEMRTVVRESLTGYPWLQIKAAVAASGEQLVRVATGYGVHTDIWHTVWTIERFAPQAVPAMEAARQQRDELRFHADQLPACAGGLLSMALLLLAILLNLQRPLADLGTLAAVIALAILGNAVVCGALSNPHDRYGARMVWLTTLVVAMVPWRMLRGRRAAAKKPT